MKAFSVAKKVLTVAQTLIRASSLCARGNADNARARRNIGKHRRARANHAPIADAHARQHARVEPDERVGADRGRSGQHRSGRDVRVLAHAHVVLDDRAGVDNRVRSDRSKRVNHGTRTDRHADAKIRRGRHDRRRVHQRRCGVGRIEQRDQLTTHRDRADADDIPSTRGGRLSHRVDRAQAAQQRKAQACGRGTLVIIIEHAGDGLTQRVGDFSHDHGVPAAADQDDRGSRTLALGGCGRIFGVHHRA